MSVLIDSAVKIIVIINELVNFFNSMEDFPFQYFFNNKENEVITSHFLARGR